MLWASSASDAASFEDAIVETLADLSRQLRGVQPHLAVVFVSPHHKDLYPLVPELVGEHFPEAIVLGCSAGGVIGKGREIEQSEGLSITVAHLPDVQLHPFHVPSGELPELVDVPRWKSLVGLPADVANPSFLLLADPVSCDIEAVLRGFDNTWPAAPKVGGMASGAPGVNALFEGESLHREGMVGLAMSGDILVETIVAQGCRPIGQPHFVTRAEGNLIFELDGVRARDVVTAMYGKLSDTERELFRTSLHLGIVMGQGATAEAGAPGDFLIRNILGVQQETGGIVVGAQVPNNRIVQFHLRDGESSSFDLTAALARYARSRGDGAAPAGALLFSCLGRGQWLYGAPDHDSQVFAEHAGPVPLGGFFCSGEIGPVAGQTWLHAYTSSFAIFRSLRGGAASADASGGPRAGSIDSGASEGVAGGD